MFIPQKHHRRSVRRPGYDYRQPGAYFITKCATKRGRIFGQITDGIVKLSPLGEMTREEWFHSASIRREIQLQPDEFVVMPNHIHGIVWITTVGADGVRPDPIGVRQAPTIQSLNKHLHRQGKSLGSFVAGFKSADTSRARRDLNIMSVRQSDYYEHIIRDEKELELIRAYIQFNPQR